MSNAPPLTISLFQIGCSFVGKTSIATRFTKNTFQFTMLSTIGVETYSKEISRNGKIINVKFWDTAGQERYSTISYQIIRKAEGIMFVYDITKGETFDTIEEYMKNVLDYKGNICYILIGNKSDCSEEEREVSYNEGKALADEYKIDFFETSAMNGDNIKESCLSLIRHVINKNEKLKQVLLENDKKEEKNDNNSNNNDYANFSLETTVNLEDFDLNKKKGCGC